MPVGLDRARIARVALLNLRQAKGPLQPPRARLWTDPDQAVRPVPPVTVCCYGVRLAFAALSLWRKREKTR